MWNTQGRERIQKLIASLAGFTPASWKNDLAIFRKQFIHEWTRLIESQDNPTIVFMDSLTRILAWCILSDLMYFGAHELRWGAKNGHNSQPRSWLGWTDIDGTLHNIRFAVVFTIGRKSTWKNPVIEQNSELDWKDWLIIVAALWKDVSMWTKFRGQ